MPYTRFFIQNKYRNRTINCIFILMLAILSSCMVFSYFPEQVLYNGHDSDFHYRRINALMQALRNGSFPIYLDYEAVNGFGYGTKWFYSDILLIPFAIMANFTGLVIAYKIMVFTMTFLCGLFTYITVKNIFKSNYTAILASFLYTFCIYRLQDLFYRASLGEAWTFTFIPLVILGFYKIINGNYKKWYILSIGYSLMIFSHLLSSFLMVIPLLIFITIYNKKLRKEPKRIIYLLVSAIVTILITAYFLFPFLEQSLSNTFYYNSYFNTGNPEYSKIPFRLLVSGMLIGIVPAKPIFIPAIGYLLPLTIICRILIFFRKNSIPSIIDICTCMGIFFVFLSSPVFPWSVFPFNKLGFIQFPWRFFEFASFFLAIPSGYYLFILFKTFKSKVIGLGILLVFLLFLIIKDGKDYRTAPYLTGYGQEASILNNYNLGELEYLPEKVPDKFFPVQRGNSIISGNKETEFSDYTKNNGILNVKTHTDKPDKLEFPLLYYKGYSATINNENLKVSESKNGLVEIDIFSGGDLEIRYTGTPIQKISIWITIISIIFLSIYIYIQTNRRHVPDTIVSAK